MRLCIVPMKPLARAKQRLAPVLTAPQRRALSLAMLTDVCSAAREGFDAVWVLHSDPDAAEVARAAGAEARTDETPDGGLNASLAVATDAALAAGFGGALIVSADLPAVTAAELAEASSAAGVVLAPDATGTGTNALWREPVDAIPVAYGAGSRAAHQSLAAERGVGFAVVTRPGLALDVDTPDDLRKARRAPLGPATAALLAALSVA